MFFVLSGYVIGITTRGPANAAAAGDYARRRFWRLVPINTAAVLLSWLVLPVLTIGVVLGNLFFQQTGEAFYWHVPLLPNNTNLWSLHYEVVYYALFLVVWRWPCRASTLFLVLAALMLAHAVFENFPPLFSTYACGAFFWFGGLWVAWRMPRPVTALRSAWPSAILAAAALWTLAPLRTLFFLEGWNRLLWPTPVSPHRLDFLPACLWVLLAVTGRGEKLQRPLGLFCCGWPAISLVVHAAAGRWDETDVFSAVALALAVLLWRWRPEPIALRRLAPVGAISYALYATASPLQFWLQAHLPLGLAGSIGSFAARVLVLVLVAFSLAWWLERRVQPWLKRRFDPPRSP